MALAFTVLMFFLCGASLPLAGEPAKDSCIKTLSVLQLNVWMDATVVEGAFDALADEIEANMPDIVTFSEAFSYGSSFTQRICTELGKRGITYYTFDSYDTGIISRYPIKESSVVESTTVSRAIVQVGAKNVAIYSAHLDYTHYACYLPRGYDGITWEKRERSTSVEEILAQNDASKRPAQIRRVIREAEADLQKGYSVIVTGDFNEPSWLDWQEDTKDMYDHNGLVIPWTTTLLLHEKGYVDCYRKIYPDAVTHPGFTWVADNRSVSVDKLVWTPDSDDRDRIDFIFCKGRNLKPLDAFILGPEGSVVRGIRTTENSADKIVSPQGIWPSDHKGVYVLFKIR